MATKKIEILENTLLKLLVRRGIDIDRQNITLAEGELGYVTDTKKLYIGDGSTQGGILVSNKFLGSVSDHTTLVEAVAGDLAYNTTNNKLYVKTVSGWDAVGGVYEAGDGSVIIDGNNLVTVGQLSAGNVSSDMLGNSLELDSNNRISLSGLAISTDSVVSRNGGYLKLPQKLSINSVNYNWPSGGTGSNLFLQTNTTGELSWAPATAPTTFFFNSTGGPIPVGTIMPYVSANGAPYGWLLCNGQEVNGANYPELSSVIGETFGSSNPGVSFKVPNYLNSALYGTDSDPATSTTFSIASGLNCSLSAQGTLLIIKAIADKLVNANLTVTDGITAAVNGIDQTGTAVSPLSGNIEIGLPLYYDTSQRVNGGTSFDLDEHGRVTTINLSGELAPAGEFTTLTPKNTQVVNETSPIVFFRSPVSICSSVTTATITAFPFITTNTGVDTGISVAPDAKNIILESRTFLGNGRKTYVFASLNPSLSGTGNFPGAHEYSIFHVESFNKDDDHSSFSQTFIPLSAAPNGSLGFVMRMSGNVTPVIRAIGYTR
jgi:microcystin-dependent protein